MIYGQQIIFISSSGNAPLLDSMGWSMLGDPTSAAPAG